MNRIGNSVSREKTWALNNRIHRPWLVEIRRHEGCRAAETLVLAALSVAETLFPIAFAARIDVGEPQDKVRPSQ